MGIEGLTSLFTDDLISLPLTTTWPQATETLTGLSWATKMHNSEMTSCRCTSSSIGMEQSQFFNRLCSKDQVSPNYLAAAIQVEQKLLALLRSHWVWSRSIILPRCALGECAALDCSALRLTTHLAGAEVSWPFRFDLSFFFLIQVWSGAGGRKNNPPSPVF